MKTLHVITSLNTGGAEKLMVDLLPRLRDLGAELDLLLFNGIETAFRQQVEAEGIRVMDFGKNCSVYDPRHILRLHRLMRKYDIVHTHNTSPQFFAAIAGIGTKTRLFTTEHSTTNRRRDKMLWLPIDRWMYNQYQYVICISKKAEENLRQYLGKTKTNILTINNGINVERFVNAQASDYFNFLPNDSRIIIQVAGLRVEKDQDTAIRALSILPKHFHLVLVGDGIRRNELEELANKTGVAERVHFTGVRSDVAELLHAADYVLMSSHYEGLSLSSVEGMCVGHPLIASDVPGLHEVVKGAGVLFPHGDDKSLAEAILRLEADPEEYKRVSDACLKRASQFDIDTMAREYMKVYKQVIEK